MMLPQMFDPETKQPLFDLELLSLDGKKGMDTVKVKEYYKNMILTSLFADVLVMGQTATGSFALGQIKNSLSGAAAKVILNNICDVLNSDLVKQTYELNGWDTSRAGKFDFDGLEAADLETLSKYWQRVASVGLVEIDREVLNSIREAAGVDPKDPDSEVDKENLTGNASRAGDGMATAGEGTSKSPLGRDTSSTNSDNKA
jgi:phage gp29-like protein